MVHTTDCIIHHQAKTGDVCVCVCLSVFVPKCLCLSVVRRREAAERQRPPFHPLLSQTGRKEEGARKETIRGRNEEHQRVRQVPVFLIQLSRAPWGTSPPLLQPPAFLSPLSSVAVIRKGRSKGAAECHCSVLALRAARVWPRVAL